MKGMILAKGATVMIEGIEKISEMLEKYRYIQSSGLEFKTTVQDLIKLRQLLKLIEQEFGGVDSFIFELKKLQKRD